MAQHFDNHPELESDPFYRKFYIFRKKSSPKKSTQSVNDLASSPSYKILKPLNDKLKSSPDKLLSISKGFKNKSSPYKTAPEEDESEDEEEEEEAEEEEEEDVEVISQGDAENSELLEADETTDASYKPKFEFVTKIQDWFIGKYEDFYEYADDQKEEFIYQTKKFNLDTKKKLSTTTAVNAIVQSLELGSLIYQQVPLIPIKDASFLKQEIISKYKFINPNFKIWDITSLIQFKFILILITWFTLSIGLPLLFSHYFNFISKKSRKTKFDPLVFNITKLILAYLFLASNVTFEDIKNDAGVWANEHGLIEGATLVQRFQAHLFHNSITLRLILGELPFIGSAVGIVVALYVASI